MYTMSVTTVKIQISTKAVLDEFKEGTESYDDVIQKLAHRQLIKDLKRKLVFGYKSLGKKDLDILKEWDPASLE